MEPRKQWWLLWLLVAFQFFHWFEPSQPYMTDYIVNAYGMEVSDLQEQVFAFDIPFFFAAAVVISSVYLFLGPRAALLLCAVASIASPLLVLYSRTTKGLLLSQVSTRASVLLH